MYVSMDYSVDERYRFNNSTILNSMTVAFRATVSLCPLFIHVFVAKYLLKLALCVLLLG